MPFYVGGTAGMRNMGAYAAGTTYYPNDMVQYSGTSYIATATTTGNLPTNTAYWNVLAVGSSFNITSQAVAYTAKPNDFVLANAAGGSFAVTLPTAPALNTMVAVKKSDATTTTVTVVPPVGVSINSDTTGVALVSNGASVTVQYDGANWQIVATGQPNIGNSVAGLPTGGGLGQILTKSSTSNYDVGWTPAPTPGGSGNYPAWVGASRVFAAQPYIPSTLVATAPGYNVGFFNFFPIQVPNACTITGMYLYNGAATSAISSYFGVYSDSPTAVSQGPARLLFGSNITFGAVGNTMYGFSNAAGLYTFTGAATAWVGFGISSGAAALYSVLNTSPTAMWPVPQATMNGWSTANWQTTRATNAWTYSAPPPDASAQALSGFASYIPCIFFTVL